MKTVGPDNTNPVPLPSRPHNMGTIMLRFVGLLLAAVTLLVLIWSR